MYRKSGTITCAEINGATSLQMYHSDGLKILNLDFTIFVEISFILLF